MRRSTILTSSIFRLMRDRLTNEQGTIHGTDGLIHWMVSGMVEKLPPDKREAAWAAWKQRYSRMKE